MSASSSTAQGRLDLPARVVLSLAALAAAWLVLVPLAMLLFSAFRGPADFLPFEDGARWVIDNVARLYLNPGFFQRLLPDTAISVLGTVGLTTAMAFALAWAVERTDCPGRELIGVCVLFPMLVPVNVLAVAWIYLMGPNAGWINLAIRGALGLGGTGPVNVFSMGGLILCQSLALTPYMFLLLAPVLRTMNPSLEEASAASGAAPGTTFRRITLPILMPGILAPVILATIITLEQFELPLMIGLPARLNIFSYRIYQELNPADGLPNYGGAAAVSLSFLGIAAILLWLYNRAIRRADRFVTMTGKAYRQRRFALGRWRLPMIVFVGIYVALAAILPAFVLIWTSFFGYIPPSAEALARFSAKAYLQLLADPRLLPALQNTLIVAVASAGIVTVLGALLGWIVVRTRLWFRGAVDFLSFLSIGIPSVIVGLAIMVFYLTVPVGLYGTVWILLVAYCYRLATTTRTARAGLLQIHQELEEASAASGAGWLTTQRRIVLPLLAPSLTAAFVLLFIVGLREFTIPLVLASDDNIVLSVLLWRLYQGGDPARTAALASLIVLAVLPAIFLLRRRLVPNATRD